MARPGWLLLNCAVQKYAWGKVGASSTVAQLSEGNPGFELDPEAPYAELWMGTHPKGPSTIAAPDQYSGQSLRHWLAANPWALGCDVETTFHGDLPFLFKVLSIKKPLSIQAHPTKDHAKELHALLPDKYPDDNHKPEMAIALTTFEAFCGFRPISEIVRYLHRVPEFRCVVGEDAAMELIALERVKADTSSSSEAKEALKRCFSSFMHQEDDIIAQQLANLVAKAEKLKLEGELAACKDMEADLLLHLHSFFPGDIGCFAVYFLNFLTLSPGEALFLAPNEPHAYISGDCVECMACSDNVVRAGLTPKFKDKKTLCDMLTYNTRPAEDNLFKPVDHPSSPSVMVYDPPVPEFAVASVKVSGKVALPKVSGPSIIIVVDGDVTITTAGDGKSLTAKKGSVIFLPVTAEVIFQPINPGQTCHLFQAYCSL